MNQIENIMALADTYRATAFVYGRFEDTSASAPPSSRRLQPKQEQYTYASTQATMCACCGKHKHTPLRIDAMGGYVCLTCIDQKLGSLLGEFGYQPTPQPQPEQEPVEFKHVCNLWIDPVSRYYIIDRCDHPPSECIPAYIKTAPKPQPEKRPQNCGTGFCSCIECPYSDHFPDAGKMIEPFGYFRSTLDGWEDCAETDEGARPLYEAPQPDRFADAGKPIEPFGYFRSTLDGWEDCAETDDGAKPLYEAPRPQHEQDNDLLTIAYMAGFDAGKEAAPQPLREPNWYCLNAIGEATLCANEQDAQQTAKDCEMFFPNQAPFRAAQLVEADRKRNEAVAEFAGKGVKGRQDIQPGATQ